ncbi:peroxisomal oxidase [Schizopora paradoxa]|uniref:Acyl-coenzyme A oxidase n=1 Tax=Schizopora paradoxa TaxID=27342 RepID=A0A0H2RU79_9AGAM|nr:peroxisomal oxidase [Schizopora paradoxa]
MAKIYNPATQTALDIEQARRRAKLNVIATREYFYGSQEEWEKRHRVVEIVSNDSVLTGNRSRRHFTSRKEDFESALSTQCRLNELGEQHGWSDKEASIAASVCGEGMAMNLHAVAFEPVVLSQGSPELLNEFGHLIRNRGILGCYLQTELGHGTNVQRIETTATYLPVSDEFEIHSPTLTSTKWWIGGLGKTATHGVVQARLILPDAKDMGPHLFLVQLRSLEDHTTMPDLKLGDIGPKTMGAIGGLDNGFARFDHYRIPRSRMLSKFAQVTKEGKYVRPPHAKISYGGMLYIRSTMVSSAGHVLAKAVTIALRYCTVRRQGNRNAGGLEEQVINYPTVHQRLLPVLSRAYVFTLLGRTILKSFNAMSSRLDQGDASLLSDMHAMTSGLKVLVSTMSVQDIETCRRSMGGHGYSAFAGVGKLYAEHLPSATYEGDNFVLDQQVVRATLKSYKEVLSRKSFDNSELSPFSSYLRLLQSGTESSSIEFRSIELWHDWKTLILVLEWRAALLVEARANSSSEIYSDQRVSKAVSDAFVASQIGEMISNLSLQRSDQLIISNLLTLYLLCTVESALVDLLSLGILNGKSSGVSKVTDATAGIRLAFSNVCRELLPEAIALSDAFGFSDWELDSALGVYDGRAYDALWAKAQTEPLNATEVADGYKQFIKPILERGQKLSAKETKAKL